MSRGQLEFEAFSLFALLAIAVFAGACGLSLGAVLFWAVGP